MELSKPVLANETSSEEQLRGTRQTLIHVLETLLRLTHPIMPYITEEIWQRVAPLAGIKEKTIMRQPYPEPSNEAIDQNAINEMEWVKDFIVGIRQIRSIQVRPF